MLLKARDTELKVCQEGGCLHRYSYKLEKAKPQETVATASYSFPRASSHLYPRQTNVHFNGKKIFKQALCCFSLCADKTAVGIDHTMCSPRKLCFACSYTWHTWLPSQYPPVTLWNPVRGFLSVCQHTNLLGNCNHPSYFQPFLKGNNPRLSPRLHREPPLSSKSILLLFPFIMFSASLLSFLLQKHALFQDQPITKCGKKNTQKHHASTNCKPCSSREPLSEVNNSYHT